jgi:hypothetical protein
MGMERSGIATEETIKGGLHKTPTTEYVPQLFDAQEPLPSPAVLILHEIGEGGQQNRLKRGAHFES